MQRILQIHLRNHNLHTFLLFYLTICRIFNHFIFFLYSVGCSSSRIMAEVLSKHEKSPSRFSRFRSSHLFMLITICLAIFNVGPPGKKISVREKATDLVKQDIFLFGAVNHSSSLLALISTKQASRSYQCFHTHYQ